MMRQQRQGEFEVWERKDEPSVDQRRPEFHKTPKAHIASKAASAADTASGVAGHPAVHWRQWRYAMSKWRLR